MKVYIHYGHTGFNKENFTELHNSEYLSVKPDRRSGIWASPVGSEFGWKDWCEQNDFRECREDNSFKFVIKNPARILTIESIQDALYLIDKYYIEDTRGIPPYCTKEQLKDEVSNSRNFVLHQCCMDFEAMQRDGYAGLEISFDKWPGLFTICFTVGIAVLSLYGMQMKL